jgi:predicted outer membrane protein
MKKLLPIALAAALVAPASAGAAKAKYSSQDETWLTNSTAGDHFEINGGGYAAKHGKATTTRALGQRLKKDHSRSLAQAVALAKSLGIKPEDKPSPSEQWELKTLREYSGIRYDRHYTDLEVYDHHQDIQEAQDEISGGTNKRVIALARADLRMYRMHLALSKAAHAAVR